MKSRQTKILNVMSEQKKISVSELAEILQVSEVTVRRDLSLLEQRGILKREHGYASIEETDDVGRRMAFNYEIKRKIAAKALASIEEGETVMIESGSCCALLAEQISENRRDVAIVTNSVFLATFLREKKSARVILLGGEFQNESQVMVGPLVKRCAENFSVNKLFVGTDGFNEFGAMSGDLMRAEAVRNMSESAQRKIILTESKKFSQTGVVNLLPYEKIDAIYTDSQIDEEQMKFLAKKNIKIVKV